MSISPYITIFKLSVARQTAYRFDFFLGRLRGLILLVIFYFAWQAIMRSVGGIRGFSEDEVLTYIMIVHVLRWWVMGSASRLISEEINNGTFSTYLVRPINHFWFSYARELGERVVLAAVAVLELFAFTLIVHPEWVGPTSAEAFAYFMISALLAHVLFFTMSYAVSLFAFWSRQAMGPRFLFDWVCEVLSGSFMPLRFFSPGIFFALSLLPFMHLIYVPLTLYFGKGEIGGFAISIVTQVAWLVVMGLVAVIVWRRGLRVFSGQGI